MSWAHCKHCSIGILKASNGELYSQFDDHLLSYELQHQRQTALNEFEHIYNLIPVGVRKLNEARQVSRQACWVSRMTYILPASDAQPALRFDIFSFSNPAATAFWELRERPRTMVTNAEVGIAEPT